MPPKPKKKVSKVGWTRWGVIWVEGMDLIELNDYKVDGLAEGYESIKVKITPLSESKHER